MQNLTIIIPHYNTPNLLSKLLNSIPAIDDIQVIVIDDNSTREVEIYQQLLYEYPHVTFLSNDKNKNSAGACRNIGIKHAKGRWILFADADDYFADGFYDVVSAFFDSKYDRICFPPTSIDLDTGETANRHIYFEKLIYNYIDDKNRKHELKLKYNFLSPWSQLISYECIIKHNISFSETLVANDLMFATKLGHHATTTTADNIIYITTLGKHSLTTTINETNILTRLNEAISRYSFLKSELGRKDFNLLDPALGYTLVSAIRNKYPPKLVFRIFAQLKKNKVRVIRRAYFNPSYLLGEIRVHSKKHEKSYYIYDKR